MAVPLRWFEDNNLGVAGGLPEDFFQRFSDPDKLDQWFNSREIMDVFMLRSASYNNHLKELPDSVLRDMAAVFKNHRIVIAINDVTATWAHLKNSKPNFMPAINMIERLKSCGWDVQYSALQSVLSKLWIKAPKKVPTETDGYPMETRIKDVVQYCNKVRRVFPDLKIGIIDALIAQKEDYKQPYLDLKDAMDKSGQELNFIILDVPFHYPIMHMMDLSFRKITKYERFVKRVIGTEFGLICADTAGKASATGFLWYVLHGLQQYKDCGGEADHYILSAWYNFPKDSIPEIVKPWPVDEPTMFSVLLNMSDLL